MNRTQNAVAICNAVVVCSIAAAIIGWQLWQHRLAVPSEAELAAGTLAPAQPDRQPDSDKQTPAHAAAPQPSDVAEPETNCWVAQVVAHPDTGEPLDVIACEPAHRDPSPYASWGEQALAGMAYGDARAAEALGLRHIQSEDPNQEALGLMLLYRAVALSGETTALHRAISQRYAVVSADGRPELHNLKQLLVFAIVARRLGDTHLDADRLAAKLAAARVPEPVISSLKDTAQQILEEMASIESEITGNRTIREALNNA